MPLAATDATCSTAPNRGLIRWDYCHLFYQAKSRKPPCGEIAPPGGANMHQNNAQPRSLPNMLRPHHSPTANQFSRPQDKADLTGTCTASPATMHLSITVPAHYAKPHVHALPAAAATAIKGGGATAVPVPLPTRLSTKSQQTAANGLHPAPRFTSRLMTQMTSRPHHICPPWPHHICPAAARYMAQQR